MKNEGLTLAFDIGHASIGWAVLETDRPAPAVPDILGSGVVIFPSDDCLASGRRGFRRQRRHIRSTRRRIENLMQLLLHLKVLTEEELNAPGHPAPWRLAARVLDGGKLLSWLELWNVLRWYAHNRGYDGNRRWSKQADFDSEDTEKEKAAIDLMRSHSKSTMAETVCAQLEVDPHSLEEAHDPAYKTLNAAFPRRVVMDEVGRILNEHVGGLREVNRDLIDTLIENPERNSGEEPAWKIIPVPGLRLPRRYQGGLLFGQFVPRFDNRIIGLCPFLYPRLLNEYLKDGMFEADAKKKAERNSKRPLKSCHEFTEYRWAMLLANIYADGKPLDKEERSKVDSAMREKGRLTHRELSNVVEEVTGSSDTNLDATFKIHPDSEDALFLDPAQALYNGEGPGSKNLEPYWKCLDEAAQCRARGRWRKGKSIDLNWMLEQPGTKIDGLRKQIDKAFAADQKKTRPMFSSKTAFLARQFSPKPLTGRAPFSKTIMREAAAEVMNGFDPRRPALSANHPKGEQKVKDGVLYRSESIRETERNRAIDELTNNHLVRHRLKILKRLTRDICKKFARGDKKRIQQVVVEVARDLQEYSGLTAKQMAQELKGRLKHFKETVAHLEKKAPDLELNGSLIRKARIAMDLNWRCPFTGAIYEPSKLREMELEHAVPYSKRKTNALHALVLTYPEVNRMKGNLTAFQFVEQFGGKEVAGTGGHLSIKSLRTYTEDVKKLDEKGHPDDVHRKKKRKALLLVKEFKEREQEFTEGALTQSSQIMRVAQRQMESTFPHLSGNTQALPALPGQITALTRKSWDLLGCLTLACPETEGITKTEVRDVTHLHHALDAITIGLTAHYLPDNGSVWRAALSRNPSPPDREMLAKLGFKKDSSDKMHLTKLPDALKAQIADSLAESRVVQHVPADMAGVKAEQNTWRLVKIEGEFAEIEQRSSEVGDDGKRKRTLKTTKERVSRLLGLNPEGEGKLAALSGVLVISENYGVALDPEPVIIPFFKVWPTIQQLKKINGGKTPRILRNGMLIRILKSPKTAKQDYSGVWRVASIKNNASGIALDIVRPAYIKARNKVDWSGMNKLLRPLLECGLEIVSSDLTGE